MNIDPDRQAGQVSLHERANLPPIEPPVATAKTGESNLDDPPLLIAVDEFLEPGLNIGELRGISPVLLGREVQNPLVRSFPKPQLPNMEPVGPAKLAIPLEHFGVAPLEVCRQTFPHHADGVHGVHDRLDARCQEARAQISQHDLPQANTLPHPAGRPLENRRVPAAWRSGGHP